MVPGFELTTFERRVSSHNHYTVESWQNNKINIFAIQKLLLKYRPNQASFWFYFCPFSQLLCNHKYNITVDYTLAKSMEALFRIGSKETFYMFRI